MTAGYFHNCTFFAVFRAGDILHTRIEFVAVPQTDPRYLFNWVVKCKKEIIKETGMETATMDIKVIPAYERQYYEICKQ